NLLPPQILLIPVSKLSEIMGIYDTLPALAGVRCPALSVGGTLETRCGRRAASGLAGGRHLQAASRPPGREADQYGGSGDG
ncbi:hypothetical protein ABT314_31870, partial [Streptomyces spiralis]